MIYFNMSDPPILWRKGGMLQKKTVINSMQYKPNVQPGTGLEKYYKQGCSQYSGPELKHVRISLLENFITSEEKLIAAKHKAG